MPTPIEEIKGRLDIVDYIGRSLTLKKAGKGYAGLCPFHKEKTPSFYVFSTTQSWYCFGCHERGDLFTFVMKQNNLDFREAVDRLATEAGIVLPERNVGTDLQKEEEGQQRLRQVNEAAALFFHTQLLKSPAAIAAREYLVRRGVSTDTMSGFRLGYAADSWNGVTTYLLKQGYSAGELVAAGLARARREKNQPDSSSSALPREDRKASLGQERRENETGSEIRPDTLTALPLDPTHIYDYFRGRVIFPIRDSQGRVIAFGGRVLDETQPRYLNTPQTALFDKSSTLFALDQARESVRRLDQIVVVEGYMDAIIAHQAGNKNVVAVIGSSLTGKHIAQIKKLTKRLVLALDADTAGQNATLRGLEVAQQGFDRVVVPVTGAGGLVRFEDQMDAEISVMTLPNGMDPDELILSDLAGWQACLKGAVPLVDFYFSAWTADLELDTPQGKAQAVKRLLPVIRDIADRIKQDAYLRRLAGLVRVDERELKLALAEVRRSSRSAVPVQGEEGKPGEAEQSLQSAAPGRELLTNSQQASLDLESYLLGLLLEKPGILPQICVIIEVKDFLHTETREVYRAFVSFIQAQSTQPSSAARISGPVLQEEFEKALPPVLTQLARQWRLNILAKPPLEGAALAKAVQQTIRRMKEAQLKQLNNESVHLKREAEQAHDEATIRILQAQTQELLKQLRAIQVPIPLSQ